MQLDDEQEQDIVLDELDQDEGQDEAETGAEEGGDEGEGEDGLTIEIDGYDPEPEEEKPLVKRLRDEIRERDRRIHELNSGSKPEPAIEVGEEPTLEGCDWLEDKFKSEWSAWNKRKQDADRQQEEQGKAIEAAKQKMDAALTTYRGHASKLGVKDYDVVERDVASALPVALQNAIPLYFGDKGPLTVLALGRHPKLLAEIVALNDPVAQLLRIKEISMGVKGVQRKTPAPEKDSIIQGSAAVGSNANKELARLEKEADKSGDRTKLIEYRRKMKG